MGGATTNMTVDGDDMLVGPGTCLHRQRFEALQQMENSRYTSKELRKDT